MRAFQSFRGLSKATTNMIWTESTSAWPYTCSQCQRDMQGGKRYIGTSMAQPSHYGGPALCPDCKSGVDPHRKAMPRLAERRTSLD